MTDDSDETILSRLRELAGDLDPVPEQVAAAARAAIETRDPDGELALLVGDSAADGAGRTYETVRQDPAGGATARLFTFDGDDVRIDIEVGHDGDQLTVVGQVSGAPQLECLVERGDRSRTAVELDDLGRFLLTSTTHGPIRLRCRSATGVRVHTPWISW